MPGALTLAAREHRAERDETGGNPRAMNATDMTAVFRAAHAGNL